MRCPGFRGAEVGLKLVAACGQGRDILLQVRLLGQKPSDLIFKAGDAGVQGVALVRQCRCQRGQPGDVAIPVRQIGAGDREVVFQIIAARLLHRQHVGQLGEFLPQSFKLILLAGDRGAQDELHDHEDRQNEHQHQQKGGHRIDKARPDRLAGACSAGEPPDGHRLAPARGALGQLGQRPRQAANLGAQLTHRILTPGGNLL